MKRIVLVMTVCGLAGRAAAVIPVEDHAAWALQGSIINNTAAQVTALATQVITAPPGTWDGVMSVAHKLDSVGQVTADIAGSMSALSGQWGQPLQVGSYDAIAANAKRAADDTRAAAAAVMRIAIAGSGADPASQAVDGSSAAAMVESMQMVPGSIVAAIQAVGALVAQQIVLSQKLNGMVSMLIKLQNKQMIETQKANEAGATTRKSLNYETKVKRPSAHF